MKLNSLLVAVCLIVGWLTINHADLTAPPVWHSIAAPAPSVGEQAGAQTPSPGRTIEAPCPLPRPEAVASTVPTEEKAEPQVERFVGATITPLEAGGAAIDLSASGKISYRVFRLRQPDRLVVDLEGVTRAGGPSLYRSQVSLLRDLRVAQFQNSHPPILRAVADLAGNPTYLVAAAPSGLHIELWPCQAEHVISVPVAQLRTAGPEVEPASSQPVAEPTRFPASPTKQPTISLGAAATAAPSFQTLGLTAHARIDGLDLRHGPLPVPSQTERPPSSLLPSPVATGTFQQPQALSAPQAPSSSRERQLSLPPPTVENTGQQPPKYTGEPISVNLKDVDLKDFFRLIHEISGLNILVDPDVTGSLTLVLDNVPWDQALDIVLRNNGLVRVTEGNLVRIAREQTITAEQEAAARLAEAREKAAPLVTVFRRLHYAQAVTQQITMMGAAGGGGASAPPPPGVVDIIKRFPSILSPRGNVVGDQRNNTVIITDIASQIPIIQAFIDKLDQKSPQVSIEARIVLATSNFERDLSTALNFGAFNKSGSTVAGGGTGTGATASGTLQFTTPPPTSRVVIGQTTANGFGAVAVSNLGARYFINAAIAAAEQRNQAKVLSAPTIVTQNNVLGEVLQGVQIPVQTVINNTVTTQYINAALQLDVTPQVTDDGYVFLIMRVQNAAPGPLIGGNPEINTQSATTQVLVPDGGTVVFGGVKVNNRTRQATQVPGLGSIPLLGNLFKSSTITDSDQELIFFVSPTIVRS
jgi:type IV pilus assembly protein PilQ